jgi:GT2 family glycosyltransferase
MEVHISIPYRLDKNLGKAYNQVMARIPEGDAACFIDYDVMLLTPDAGRILYEYANSQPESLLTCFTNRISPLSRRQLLNGAVSGETDIKKHIALAEDQRKLLYQVTPIQRDISGMLMVIPKSLWVEHPFDESQKCLGVDTYYGRRIREAGRKILRMNGLYVFHTYRLLTGITDKTHLQ